MSEAAQNILFLVPTTGFGGAELHTLTLAKHFRGAGQRPVMAFPHSLGTIRLYQECMASGIEVVDMPIAPVHMATPRENISEQSRRLRAHLDPAAYDAVVVASPSPMTGAGLLDALTEMHLPGICIFHLVPENLFIPRDARLTFLRCLRRNFRFVCVSEFTRDMLCKALHIDPADGFIDIVTNGTDIVLSDKPFPLKTNVVGDSDARTVVTVGRIHPQKGGYYLIDAIPLVLQAHPDVRFIWFGEGPQQEELEIRAREIGVSYALAFPGYTDQAADAMAAADVVALPTLYEGLSLSLLEAMHSGAAIVTTDASYQDRILTDRVHAGIARRGDTQSFAEKIIEVLDDPILAETYRANVSELAVHYSKARMCGEYEVIVQQLIDMPKSEDVSPTAASVHPTIELLLTEHPSTGSAKFVFAKVENGRDTRRTLSPDDVMSALVDIVPRHSRLMLSISFSDSCEVVVPPTAIEGLLNIDEDTLGGAILTILMRDHTPKPAQAFFVYGAVLDALTAAAETRRSATVVRAIVALRRRFELPPLTTAQRLLAAMSNCETRAVLIEDMAMWAASQPTAEECAATLTRILTELELGRNDIALLKAHYYRAINREEDAEIHFTIHAALEGASEAPTGRPRRKVVFFAEYFNYPAINGSDRRMLSLIEAYRSLGFDVHFFGLEPERLVDVKRAQAAALRGQLGIESHYIRISADLDDTMRDAHRNLALGQNSMDRFFSVSVMNKIRELLQAVQPAIIHVNYCYFSWVAAAAEGLPCHRVLDTHDFISRRLTLNRELLRYSGGNAPKTVQDIGAGVHDPSRHAALRYNILPDELIHLAQFDTVLMISPVENTFISPHMTVDTLRTLEMYIPYAPMPEIDKGDRCIRALYTGGNNIYNMIGAAAIQKHILPYLDAQLGETTSFSIRVAGDVGQTMRPHRRLELMGRIHDIDVAYLDVDFALCPIPAGTGQNVKIVEALSHGVPVIAYSDIGRTANVVNGVNGVLVGSLSEMRLAIIQLVADARVCQELKCSTRAWASKYYQKSRFNKNLRLALESTGFKF